MKEKYIKDINNLLPNADLDLLDFVYQLLEKSVTPSKEALQSA